MKAALILFGYAATLVVLGIIAFSIAAVGGEVATTALIFTLVPAALAVACGVMAGMLKRNRRIGMIGIHVGLVLPALFAIAYGMRAYQAFTGDSPQYLAYILTLLAAASVAALLLLLAMRPKPEDRK